MNRRADLPIRDADADYLCWRVVDSLLREDLRQCLSRGEVVAAEALPADLAGRVDAHAQWLRVAHLGRSVLWLPVRPAGYMQAWQLAGLPLWRQQGAAFSALDEVAELLAVFSEGLAPEAARPYAEFGAECAAALAQRRAAEAERSRWFDAGAGCGLDLPGWGARLLHYDRLAAFLDHPYYPTARAKLGLAVQDLARYAPEFAPRFELHWLAVPRALYAQRGQDLPPGWPGFAELGLPESLAADHELLPVHPFVWQRDLDRLLAEAGLAGQVRRAPLTRLAVTPTLSVRTLALCDAPAWHLKLPLTMRTLGAKNIRTIKPSTIGDGHRIQSLLGEIVAREPALAARVLLTWEDTGAHVDGRNFLGFIVRRYPEAELAEATLVPVAGLLAEAPGGGSVLEEIVAHHFGGELDAFLDAYLELTLRLHLTLWLRYGIALESNQQNSVLVFEPGRGLRLLLKDNDAARIQRGALAARWPALADHLAELEDERILVADPLPLAQMFITITLQLNLAAPLAGLAARQGRSAAPGFARIAARIAALLDEFAAQGEEVALARRLLLEAERLPIKYLLVAATLVDKAVTGARDVNKFYGETSPNFLRVAR